MQLGQLKLAAREHHLDVEIEDAVRQKLIPIVRNNLQHGGRGIRNMVDAALVNPLNRALFDRNITSGRVRLIDLHDHGVEAVTRFDLEIEVMEANG